jgi:DNA-binding XRE family transcriptional regulator
MMNPVTKIVGAAADPDVHIRLRWAENLRSAMKLRDVTKAELIQRLRAEGITVTRQAIETWLAGEYAPRPHIQQAIGKALNYEARAIFTLEAA